MKNYYEYIDDLAVATGSLAKLEILKVALKDTTFKLYAKEIFNPYFNRNIRKVPKVSGNIEATENKFPELYAFLKKNQSRTTEAVELVEAIFSDAHPAEHPALEKFIKGDMRCGVSRGLISKILPDLIPKFDIGLAAAWREQKLQFPGWIEPKLDGIRCLAMVADGNVTFMSRNGKSIELFPEFATDIIKLSDGDDFVFDGELMGTDFQQLMTQTRRKKNKDQTHLVFHIFDGMPLEHWESQKSEDYINRKSLISLKFATAKGLRKVFLVHGECVETPEEMMKVYNLFLDQGYEGCIIKQNSGYAWKRSYDWMKLKPVLDIDLPVVDVLEGRGKYQGSLGALVVEHQGVLTRVGSGYNDSQREEYWKNKNALIGKIIEVEFQNETNDGRLRFPVFKTFRPDKD